MLPGLVADRLRTLLADAPTSHVVPMPHASGGLVVRGLSTNAAVLDGVVFLIGFSLLGGVLLWYARRIFNDS